MLQPRGIIPPIVTPLTPDERVDEDGLSRQLERLVAGGVHAIYFLGSTGEQAALRDSERSRATGLAKELLKGRLPLIVGTMASSTARAIDNIRAAEAAGADAVAVTPPHYYPSHGPAEQIAHYKACAAATGLPVLVYNIPLTTKVMLSAETVGDLAEIPNVIGIKDSSGDFVHFLKILNLMQGTEFACLIGSPALIGPSVVFGGHGAVPGIANLDPSLLVRLYEAASLGNIEEVRFLQRGVADLLRVISFGPPIACLKTALELMGVCGAATCQPLQPLAPETKAKIAEVLRKQELL